MERASLKARLKKYFRANHSTWIAKGHICDLARSTTGATGEHTGRRLRELTEEGVLDVEQRKGHSWYRLHKNDVVAEAQLEAWKLDRDYNI